MESRLKLLEERVEHHHKQISKLFGKIEDTNQCIQKIMTTMAQIKWTFYGAVGYYAVSELGLLKALKILN
tara:strand:+ start:21 stop:230 length:210 start_codon:yes stop_codon:yes gene_type:complete